MVEFRLSTFTAADGDNLAVHEWRAETAVAQRGIVVLVHGLGEHMGRYQHVAAQLTQWGFGVRGYDQYGHGESGGGRGTLSSNMRLVDDLADVVDSVRMRFGPRVPLIVLGHSMGALVAAAFVAAGTRPIDGLVLSSPAFGVRPGPLQKLMLNWLPDFATDLAVRSGIKPEYLSRDPAVVAAYRADPLVHDRISARLARFIIEQGPRVVSVAAHWDTPTLLLFGGADRVVDAQASRRFAAAAPPDMVSSRCFEIMAHEVFNEPERALAFNELRRWLDARFPE